ncbi:MAG: hypothetical protein LBU90_01290 [Bacteroidales bacterium]|jgi:hypothetical protein|nr:hypothetical protein [Bacteroidales bacterium]
MKIFRSVLIFILPVFASVNLAYCQCSALANAECKQRAAQFTHYDSYTVNVIAEGERVELSKLFTARQQYRIALCSEAQLPQLHISVMDTNRTVLFSNTGENYTTSWDFTVKKTQQLLISVEVETIDDHASDSILQGCAALLIGTL